MTKTEVKACPKCGSMNVSGLKSIFMAYRKSPVSSYSCSNCGYEGIPLLFDSKKDYKKFLELKQKKK